MIDIQDQAAYADGVKAGEKAVKTRVFPPNPYLIGTPSHDSWAAGKRVGMTPKPKVVKPEDIPPAKVVTFDLESGTVRE